MNGNCTSDLLLAMIKLGALQARLATIAAEAAWTFGPASSNIARKDAMQSISQKQIDAVSQVINRKLLDAHDLGFQCLLRINFSEEHIREMAKAALAAAAQAAD
jgi:hypothetical protein